MEEFNKKYFEDGDFNRGKTISFYDIAYSSFIKNNLKKGSKILEIGCSYGHLLRELEEKYNTTGIDISAYAINKAKNILKSTKLIQMNIEKDFEKLDNKKFDAIIAIDVFEHFRKPPGVIRKCFSLLNEGGILVLKVPNKSSIILNYLKIIGREDMWDCYQDKTHYSLFGLRKWGGLFEKEGFEVKILASPPTNKLKTLFRKNPNIFFSRFNLKKLNQTISLFCYKPIKNETQN
ncbi:MAG: class I SAM-dependent methyltransferase [Candidatus Omnitrophica bacterium]|nr:class I SAM-dependent methyltransferase [Candidatus Omnitrophota bacterium]